MGDTTIEWTDAVWNPVTGCTKVSQGCKNCYAERVFPRAYGKQTIVGSDFIERARRFTDVRLHWQRLDEPPHWRKPRRVFVNSMSDLFHEDVPDEFIGRVWRVMAEARQHTFQILTKRPSRALDWLLLHGLDSVRYGEAEEARELERRWPWPLPNVWLGVSVEDQATADERVPVLLQTPAAVRFVSYEPALGPVDFSPWLPDSGLKSRTDSSWRQAPALGWVIVGGESGPKARSFDVAWARSTMEQCRASGVPVFVKQMGDKPITDYRTRPPGEPAWWTSVLSRKGGDAAEWPEDLRVREYPR